jgi:hypothetical protein
MFRRLRTALLLATAISLLSLPASAGVKSGGSFHSPVAPHIQPFVRPPHHHPGPNIHKFSHHHQQFWHRHRHRSFDFGLPYRFGDTGFYDPYFAPTEDAADVATTYPYPVLPGSFRDRPSYRTGCRSEEVSVPSAHGPTFVTVTRCSVPIVESPTLK